ncbi:MAG: hypothetical protein EA385_17255 [Salinarimonadaceae bacterium]|nr:MAG: hypothetical protein EA385_17255 [Salinarimonadaceae bacterium]
MPRIERQRGGLRVRIEVMVCPATEAPVAAARMRDAWGDVPDWLWVQHSVVQPAAEVGRAFAAAFPGTALHIATSCLGAMDNGGAAIGPGGAIGALALWDPAGDFGAAAMACDGDMRSAARAALDTALARAGRPGEAPELIWLSASPGAEEVILDELKRRVGADTPVYGGSAADDDVSGRWAVGDGDRCHGAGLVISVLFPGAAFGHAFQSGYAPMGPEGTVTAANGRRLVEIDGRPARAVYNDWTGGAVIDGDGDAAVSILAPSTWRPLGRPDGALGGVPFHLLLHPAEATADGALVLFADVAEGECVQLMGGTPESLTARAARTVALAAETAGLCPADIAGALVIFCGGSMLAMQATMSEVAAQVDRSLGGAPFLGGFTFGEQGPRLHDGNGHGNLMISAIVFGRS